MTTAPRASLFAPFRHRGFAVVWTGAFVSNVGTWMQAAALGYYVAHMTRSAGWSAVVAAGEFAPTALLGPIGGAIADRWSRRTIFLVTTLVQGVFAAALTAAMVAGHPGPGVIALYALGNGCMFALGFPAFQSLLPELVPPEVLPGAIGVSSASWNLGRVIGPVLGTFVYYHASIAWVLGINAVSFGAVVIALLTLHVVHHRRAPAPLFEAIAAGFRFVWGEDGLRLTVLALCLNTLFVAPFIGLIPAMVEKELGGGKPAVGWLITAQGVGAVVMGVVFGRLVEVHGLRRVMLAALVGGPVAVIAYGIAPNVPVAALALLVTGALYFAAMSSFSSTAQLRAPAEFRGRALSINQMVLGTVYAFSVNAEGWLGDRIGLRVVTVGGAALSLAVLLIVRIVRPSVSEVLDRAPG